MWYDHKLLLKLFGDGTLEDIPNNRFQNLKEKTLRYRFQMIHIPAVKHRAADCVSRHPTGEAEKLYIEDRRWRSNHVYTDYQSVSIFGNHESSPKTLSAGLAFVGALHCSRHIKLNSLSMKSVTWERVWNATTSDNDMQELVAPNEAGMPKSRHELPETLKAFVPNFEMTYTLLMV